MKIWLLKSTNHVQILQKLKQNSDATPSKMPHTHTIKELEDLEPGSYWNNSNIYICDYSKEKYMFP